MRPDFIFIVISCVIQPIRSQLTCGQGEYLHQETCRPCPAHTFMPVTNHQYQSCQMCTRPDPHLHEVLLDVCTRKSDTVIGCRKGYFREEFGDSTFVMGECTLCSSCDYGVNTFQIRPCGTHSNTVCCPHPKMFPKLTSMGRHGCVYNY